MARTHFTLAIVLCTLATVLGQERSLKQVAEMFGTQSTGDQTYYGAGADSAGTCGHGTGPASSLPWYNGIIATVAMNAEQFAGSLVCGTCLTITRNGQPMGNVIVNNLCPECKYGDLDWAQSGDGRWSGTTFQAIPCPVAGSPFSYNTAPGTSEWYMKLAVWNTMYPVQSVSCNGNALSHTSDGMFEGAGCQPGSSLAITSVMGETVYDTLPGWGFTTGTAQFGGQSQPQPVTEQSGDGNPDPNNNINQGGESNNPDPNNSGRRMLRGAHA